MPIQISGQAGPQAIADGTGLQPFRQEKSGAAVVQELHGRYFEQVSRGNVFVACSQAVATTTVGLATTYTGLCVSNPVGSGKQLALLIASLMQSVIQATQPEAYAIATGFNAATDVTHTTPLTPRCALVGSSATPVGKADTAATLPTAPFYSLPLGETASATTQPGTIIADIGGGLVLLPGAYAMFVTPAQASVAGLWFSLLWEEVPL
jgi:hypothetical protein